MFFSYLLSRTSFPFHLFSALWAMKWEQIGIISWDFLFIKKLSQYVIRLKLNGNKELCDLINIGTYRGITRFYRCTLRRKNTDTFASVCSKMAIFKRLENYPKDMQNSLSFHLLIGHIGEASDLVTKFPLVLKIRTVKVENAKKDLFYEVKMERSNFDSSYFQNHWKFCNQNSFRSFPNMVNQLVKR